MLHAAGRGLVLSELTPLDVAAPVVALLGLYLYLRLGRAHYGPEADYVEVIRRSVLPQLNRLARRRGWGYTAYRLGRDEFVGYIEDDPEVVEERLHAAGYERMPLAAFKYSPDGRPEVGSWAWRESLLATRQVHVMLFETGDGEATEVYAHDEFNAYNPRVALAHYLGLGYVPLGGLAASVVADSPKVVRAEAAARRGE